MLLKQAFQDHGLCLFFGIVFMVFFSSSPHWVIPWPFNSSVIALLKDSCLILLLATPPSCLLTLMWTFCSLLYFSPAWAFLTRTFFLRLKLHTRSHLKCFSFHFLHRGIVGHFSAVLSH